jgi:hypothetical protein
MCPFQPLDLDALDGESDFPLLRDDRLAMTEERVLRRAPYVSMVQATELRNGHDFAISLRRD